MLDRRFYAKLSTAVFVVCTSLVAAQVSAQATQIKPRFLIVVDTSLSMDEAAPANSCGAPAYPATKMGAARCAIKNVLNSIGDAEFALMQFAQVACGGTAGTCNQTASSATLREGFAPNNTNNTAALLSYVDGVGSELCAGGLTPLGGVLAGARGYFTGGSSPTAADTAAACRPLNVILLTDGVECCGSCQAGGCPNAATDTAFYLGAGITCQTACISQGTCNGGGLQHSETAPERAWELYNTTNVPTPSGMLLKRIKTYPIGLGVPSGDVRIENIAKAGHTNAPGANFANYATDEATLSAALNQIILDSQLTEVCDGVDNDCDTRVDEGYAKYCDIDRLRTTNGGQTNVPACLTLPCPAVPGVPGNSACAQPEWSSSSTCTPPNLLCADPGEICDQSDDDCDGHIDEGAPPTGAQDTCDLIDNDCDGQIDENCNPNQCTPEICDGLDNNCIGGIDEGLSRQCGTDTGSCTSGVQTCQNGQWGAPNPSPGGTWQLGYCPDVSPGTELCNNLDDNCDGVIDQITRPCSPYGNTLECLAGVETCIAGVWQSTGLNGAGMSVMPSNPSACLGARGPTIELCDGKDNDCMPGTADGSADSRLGKTCGNSKGICLPGTTVCTSGNVVCNDFNEATSETCDGLDNDCDGKIDENTTPALPGVGDACFPGMPGPVSVVGECEAGAKACIAGNLVCLNYTGPSIEICDTLDNDCNASTPDGAADPALNQACGTSVGECDPGINTCMAGMIVCTGGNGPVAEVCDGKDNDCDNLIDEQLPDTMPADGIRDIVSCGNGVGLCMQGELTCVAVPINVDPDGFDYACVGGVHPVPEFCDGDDNDCDGATDECAGDHSSPAYLACLNAPLGPLGAGGGQTCGNPVAPCQAGKTKCVADADGQGHPGFVCVGRVDGGPELCNRLDDDCDTKIDEDLDPINDPRLGQVCDQSTVGSCRDTNSQPCGRCRFGTQVCVMGDVVCIGAIAPAPYESCNKADDDCDDTIDECVDPNAPNCVGKIDPNTPVGTTCGVNAGACMQGLNACVDGALVCQNGVGLGQELCNGRDDDCDVLIDEGFPIGAPCGSSVGECQPGGLVCPSNGMLPLDCVGAVVPTDELCDALDNDCDGMVDEGLGLGETCGSSIGRCKPAKLACVGGRSVCVGEIGPQPESCDCQDNDCDGKTDEESATEALCPGGSTCEMCQCAFPCDPTQEFAQCPQGKAAVTGDKGCFCVGELCKDADCRNQTISVNDAVQCAPKSDEVGYCFCKNNECTFSCSGVTCDQALVCDPTDGRCKQKSCLLPQFRCPADQRCSLVDDAWQCVGDPCASADCASDEACRAGTCVESCANVACAAGTRCLDGACVVDHCATVSCETGLACNPTDGACVIAGICVSNGCPSGQSCDRVSGSCSEDICLSTRCPYGQTCNSETGQCELRCAGNQLFCDGECVNPAASRVHCGASGDCQGDNAGEVCPKGKVCSLGTCSTSCANDLLDCGGDCIDPRSDMAHCGAKDDCQGGNDGEVCSVDSKCVDGACNSIVINKPDPVVPNFRRVLAAGGGGCACSVGVGTDASGHSRRGLSSIGFLLLGFTLLGRRRLLGRAVRSVGVVRIWLALVVLIASAFGAGCKVDSFCLNCPDPKDSGIGGASGVSGEGESGSGGVVSDSGRTDTDASMPTGDGDAAIDAALAQPDGGCTTIELCNGIDDDCDGKLDEDADPALLNIDVKTNVNHCGACGHTCAIDHAFNQCAAGVCKIDRSKGDQGCDVGFRNLDDKDENGCEYRCVKRTDEDTACDLVDNDCDGTIDEDVDLNTDPHNCGSCGARCSFVHASAGSTCVDKTCVLDDQQCDDGYASVDSKASNGCEYHCPVWPAVDETCNGLDDDCDGIKDEDVTNATDARIGIACGSVVGACDTGLVECIDGLPTCVGDIRPQPEECDGIDNNCDGNVDSDDSDIGQPCGVAYPGSQCSRGTLQIPLGGCQTLQPLACMGGQGPTPELCNGLDDDCDGQADEAEGGAKPEEGQKCINGVNGAEVVASDPPQWNASTICRTGATVCESGNLVCRNEIPPAAVELCDNLDQNCDGNPIDGFAPDSSGGTTTITGPDPSIGKSCGVDTGECAFGVRTCHLDTLTSSCDNQVLPGVEACDGKDNDCDGKIDETDATTGVKPIGAMLPCVLDALGVMQYGANVMATAPCVAGETVCVAGQVACPDFQGRTAELCDAIDQDCDGILKEVSFPADTRINAACDTDSNTTGVCNTGTQYCDASGAVPMIRCMGEVFASPDLCDGLDNDCNAATADGSAETWVNDACSTNVNGTVNLSPAVPVGICTLGTAVCLGGIQQCVNEVGPQLEVCDVQAPADLNNPMFDQNCNGMVDEDFQLQSNVSRCGTCSTNCTTGQPNANMICNAGLCQISSCKVGYYDDKRTLAPDCTLHDGVDCDFGGLEVCDGQDNDCDGLADETSLAQPIALPAANQFCLQVGACAGSAVQCKLHKIGDVANTTCTGTGDVTCVTEPVCTIRPSPELCDAPYNLETSATYDNDCDGQSDSVEFNLSASCAFTGPGAVGACATVGNRACDLGTPAPTDTFCANGSGQPVTVGAAGAESTCNNTDDDCDGKVDEACGLVSTSGSCVTDAWVPIPNTSSSIYAYEASRPDATSAGSGTNSSRACSVAGRLPWGNLTWDEAQAACEGTDPTGRLCTEDEWQAACQVVDGTATLCAWSFANNCGSANWVSDTCNGLDYVATQEPEPTGWTGAPATSSTCYRPHAGSNVFDLSGNMKEYVDLRANGTIPVRGGASNNARDGLKCDFNYTVWPNPNVAKFPNVGFRCCRGPRCVRYNSSDTPISDNAGARSITSTINVTGSLITSVTKVAATVRGSNTDMDDLTFRLVHGATNRLMVDLTACNDNLTVNPYNVTFDASAVSAPTVATTCGFLSGGASFQPAESFTNFNGSAADGAWQFLAVDNDTAETNNVTSWSLWVCGD